MFCCIVNRVCYWHIQCLYFQENSINGGKLRLMWVEFNTLLLLITHVNGGNRLQGFCRIVKNHIPPCDTYPYTLTLSGPTSVACCLLRATCAAITRCLSTTSRQLAHWQSLQRQKRLCPFRQDTTPWFRQRAHFGVRLSFLCSPMPLGAGLSSPFPPSASSSPSGADPGRLQESAWSSLSVSRLSTSISNSQPALSDMTARVLRRLCVGLQPVYVWREILNMIRL